MNITSTDSQVDHLLATTPRLTAQRQDSVTDKLHDLILIGQRLGMQDGEAR